MDKTVRPRISWVDYAKGLGIFLVVLGHVLRGLNASQILNESPAYRFVDAWIYTFHMPLFFLLAGLFVERQVERGSVEFIRDKLSTIAYPYLVWSTIQTLVMVATSRHTNHPTNLADLVGIWVEPVMQFWFLYALFLISLIYLALRLCGLQPLGVLAAFALFWLSQGSVSLGTWAPLYPTRNSGIYFALGSAMNRLGWTERVERAPAALLALAVLIGYGVVTVSAALRWIWPPALLLGLAFTLCGVIASIALAVLLGRTPGLGFVRVLGFYSLEIFVAHTIASAGIRIALAKALKIEDPTTHIVLGTVGGIALPLALSWLCRRYHAEFLFRLPRRSKRPALETGTGVADQ